MHALLSLRQTSGDEASSTAGGLLKEETNRPGQRSLIMDEPSAALGVPEQREVHELIETPHQHSVAVILISHNMHDVFAVADWVIVLRHRSRHVPIPVSSLKSALTN